MSSQLFDRLLPVLTFSPSFVVSEVVWATDLDLLVDVPLDSLAEELVAFDVAVEVDFVFASVVALESLSLLLSVCCFEFELLVPFVLVVVELDPSWPLTALEEEFELEEEPEFLVVVFVVLVDLLVAVASL